MQESIDIQDVTSQQDELRYNIYTLLASLFRDAPSQAALTWLQTIEVETDAHRDMTTAWEMLKLAASASTEEQIKDEYQLLFIGIGRGEIVPYCSWYLTGSLMELPLAKLRQDLRALGFERQDDIKEPEDHIAAMLEVMAMLVQEGDTEAQRIFFNNHIAPWYQKLCGDIKQAASVVFYNPVAELADHFLTIEKVRFTKRH